MNDHRDHDRPFSADSSKNVPGRLAASLRYADSGVSLSASTLRVTGTTRCSAASARKSSRDVVIARLAVDCTHQSSQTLARGLDDAGVSGLVSTTGACAMNRGVAPRCTSAACAVNGWTTYISPG